MSDFRIFTADNEPVPVTEGTIPSLRQYELCHAEASYSTGGFGEMLFQHYTGKGFDIWYCNYLISKTSSFIGTANSPILELQIPLLNEFESSWDGMEHVAMKPQQFEMTFTPFVKTRSRFLSAKQYQTFDVHFTTSMLAPYAVHCRKMSIFLEQVLKGRPANLLDMIQYLSVDMLRIIYSVLQYDGDEKLCQIYFDALIQELLTLVTIQVAGLTDKPRLSVTEIRQGTEAREIIMNDFENNYTITELAKMTGSTELKLQMVFKYLFGTTVYKFSRQARLAHAFKLLQTTNYPLRVVSLMVGYPDAPNFFAAFKNQYGFGPGRIQKRQHIR